MTERIELFDGLYLEDIIEYDLEKQYENYLLLCRILEAEPAEQNRLLDEVEAQFKKDKKLKVLFENHLY